MVDVNAQIDAVERGIETRDVDGVPSRVQTLGQTYRSSVQDVWDAITSADRIGRWFLPITGDLRLGGRYELEGNASGTVETCSPPGTTDAPEFRVTWEFGGGVTWLTVRLHPLAAEETRLELEHVARVED
ncbi:MAG: SRPBCC domain-containing protein, partial [Chloroflexota bacterium]|nr:SRPBCC domain-containing protein [Chloroflexota bacterium]